MQFKNKKIAVLGLSRSGLAAANLLARQGARVFVSEIQSKGKVGQYWSKLNKNVSTEFGQHSEKILDSELIVLSPGVHTSLPILQKARKINIPIISELEVAWRFIKPRLTIAVTGTNGKTTTTTLIGEIFRAAGKKVIVAGNIGLPLSDCVNRIDGKTFLVLEVSSYQLENIATFRPDIAVILNLTPDHLQHHRTLSNYWEAKKNIFVNQTETDYLILNYDDQYCRRLSGKTKSKIIFFSRKKMPTLFSWEKLLIPGRHNLENALASSAVALIAGISCQNIRTTLANFEGVEHRLEKVATIRGINFINDSKATNVDSTVSALKSFSGNLILIIGGQDKGSPYTPLIPLVKKKVKALLLIGEAQGKIARDLKNTTQIFFTGTMDRALRKAFSLAKRGDTVLLSPACASFDQYENFEQRGKHFKELVKRL